MASFTWLLLPVLQLLTGPVIYSSGSMFDDLSAEEITSIRQYLESQADLQIIANLNAKVKDSYIWLMEAYRPNKVDALAHLDEKAAAPDRVARVILHRGDLDPPRVEEYKVWPLPNPTNHKQLKHTDWKDPIPFHARSPFGGPDEGILDSLMYREFQFIGDVISRATDGYTFKANCTGKCLRYFPGMPAQSTSGNHQLTGYFVRDIEGGYLYPIGLQFVLLINSVDETEWTTGGVWFRGQRFDNFRHMGSALAQADDLRALPEPRDARAPTLPSSMHQRGARRPAEVKRGPVTYMPDGARYEVSGRHVEWLGWEFDFGMLASSGIQLFDVRFLNERIAYELALQELSVFYSGGSPVPAHTNYYDSVLVFGHMTAEMFPGIDCPEDAHYFDFIHYMNGHPMMFKRGACVFEMNLGIPLRRHYENDFKAKGGYRFAAGMPDNVLVFRHILTVLNYDYIIDVILHQAGQMEVKLTLTGYVLSTFYTGAEMDKYGHRLNDDNAIGNVHHHTANFKVDLDIKGTKNRFQTLNIELEEVEDTLTPNAKLFNRHVVREVKKTERDAAYRFNFDAPKYLIVYNDESRNKYGDVRGYRIYNAAVSKMLLPTDYRGYRARAWTNYQVAITKHKEDERCSSSVYTATEPFDPVMSFEDFIGNESIEDEDLVAWVTVGTHHIPHTEDVPIVNTPGVQLTFYLLPYNYFDQDPSMASRDNIRVTPAAEKPGEHVYHRDPGMAPPVDANPAGACGVTSVGAAPTAPSPVLALLLVAGISTRWSSE